MNRLMMLVIVLALPSCQWNEANNPVSPSYPCGTRAHACSVEPLSCCWNGYDCGAAGTSCPAGMCCFVGDDYGASPDAGAKTEPQWKP